jgi:hypothetical protein
MGGSALIGESVINVLHGARVGGGPVCTYSVAQGGARSRSRLGCLLVRVCVCVCTKLRPSVPACVFLCLRAVPRVELHGGIGDALHHGRCPTRSPSLYVASLTLYVAVRLWLV